MLNGSGSKGFCKTTLRDNSISVGGDAKIAIGDGLNLDLTFNP